MVTLQRTSDGPGAPGELVAAYVPTRRALRVDPVIAFSISRDAGPASLTARGNYQCGSDQAPSAPPTTRL